MRIERLAGIVLIVIGSLGLLSRTATPNFAGKISWGEPQLLDSRTESIDASQVRSVFLDVEAGSLRVVGERGASQAELSADFMGPDESALKALRLEHRIEGDELRVWTRTSKSKGSINLTLALPSRVSLRIEDGSGSIRVESIDGQVTIDDGSGSIGLTGLGSDLRIQDGSGSIRAEDVAGSVRIDDGSGSIRVSDAGGDVELTDGSGSITVRHAGGDVVVRDGSGSINVRDVDGRFRLLSDGSGSVSTSGIRGGGDS